jgi:hypothetical protein
VVSAIRHSNPDGGVARYYRLDLARNHAVSTEITGYAASAFVFLHALTYDPRYLDRARRRALPHPRLGCRGGRHAV